MEKPQRTELPRRKFIKEGIGFGISLSVVLSNASYFLYDRQPPWKERCLTITPEGHQIGVILGNHGSIDPETGKIDISVLTHLGTQDLFSPVGAFFNDGWTNSLMPEATGEMVADSIDFAINKVPGFYKAPFEFGLKNNIPFIFGDINLIGSTTDQLVESYDPTRKALLISLATMVAKGGEIALDNYSKFFRKKTKRRDFLKLLVTGGLTGGLISQTYFSSPAFVHVARELGIKPEDQSLKDFQAIFSDIIHPDNYAIVMRNIVWALKCREFFDVGIISKDKVINVIGGLNHRFLDFFLQYPDLAKKYWQLFNYKEIAGLFSQGDTSWVNHSLIFYPTDKHIERIDHPNLGSLVA